MLYYSPGSPQSRRYLWIEYDIVISIPVDGYAELSHVCGAELGIYSWGYSEDTPHFTISFIAADGLLFSCFVVEQY